MRQEYYSLPLSLGRVMLLKEHPKCTIQQSVAQQLHLILITAFGEVPVNERFGCNIWEYDFDNLTSSTKLKELIRQSILQSIQLHEIRLENIHVELTVSQEEMQDLSAGHRLKKRMDITITGLIHLTNENFTYRDNFFVGPLSY